MAGISTPAKERIMKLMLAGLLLLAATVPVFADEPLDYKTAYAKAQQGDKPMLVLVTATWCPPCQSMKATTIPQLLRQDAFKDFHYATVDLDEEAELAQKLIGNRGVPQLIVFEKLEGKWQKRYMAGYQTVANVEKFILNPVVVRTADATVDAIGTTEKK
jgi:thioredoxin-like negative regulator of GroEL